MKEGKTNRHRIGPRISPNTYRFQDAQPRGEAGPTVIRGGRRTLELMPAVALTVYFDVTVAYEASAPLARAVFDAGSLDEANEIMRGLGVRSELDWELDAASDAARAR